MWVDSCLLEVPNILRFLDLSGSDLPYSPGKIFAGNPESKVPTFSPGGLNWPFQVNFSSLKLSGHILSLMHISLKYDIPLKSWVI